MAEPLNESLKIADAVIDSIVHETLTDDDLLRLQHTFPEQTIIGALDLIDRGNVLKYTTAWEHTEYEVIGSNGTYLVLLEVSSTEYPYFCSCPAFLYYVHQQKNHVMCKHILATRIANRISACSERQMKLDELASLYARLYPTTDQDHSVGHS